MAFLEDPRLRQRWNQITHDAEAVTENAAAGIWSFQHNYIHPCFGSLVTSIEQCTTLCLGDQEERRRRHREREREQAATNFDFYDDWYEEEQQGGGLLGGWGGEDWDRLLAGTGSQRRHGGGSGGGAGGGGGGGETSDQPRRKRGMSYGTRPARRRGSNANDPTIIPSTQPLGFLSKLPWKMGGTLRYKPSAANLQEHPGKHENGEEEPLLGSDSSSDFGEVLTHRRKRSGTTGSGDTSDSYRSRGDLFPSDGEGEEDAVPLDDEVTFDMLRKDDRSSGKTRSSKGKRPAFGGSRTVSRTTLGSLGSQNSPKLPRTFSGSLPATPDADRDPYLEDAALAEEQLRREEDEKIARDRQAAQRLASERGLKADTPERDSADEAEPTVTEDEPYEVDMRMKSLRSSSNKKDGESRYRLDDRAASPSKQRPSEEFVPARLPHF